MPIFYFICLLLSSLMHVPKINEANPITNNPIAINMNKRLFLFISIRSNINEIKTTIIPAIENIILFSLKYFLLTPDSLIIYNPKVKKSKERTIKATPKVMALETIYQIPTSSEKTKDIVNMYPKYLLLVI